LFFLMDQIVCPYPTRSLPTQFWHWCMEWSTVWVSSKLWITEEIWPVRGLNLGLPNDTRDCFSLVTFCPNIITNYEIFRMPSRVTWLEKFAPLGDFLLWVVM
jgi:hypothetical protein